jgi:uracil-DNA glycosylase family protein
MSRSATRSAQPFLPTLPPGASPGRGLETLTQAAAGCRGCDLYLGANQVVFASGPPDAAVVMVGEQPGDIEDKEGEPFVGPAGRLLRQAMDEVGIPPGDTYLTNAVKHFKFHQERGSKRRLHDTPKRTEIVACRPWLVAEFALLRPLVVVALGAVAGGALVGPTFRVTKVRGQLLDWPDIADHPEDFPSLDPPARFVATVHPSSVLRAEDRDAAYAAFLADLAAAGSVIAPDAKGPTAKRPHAR